MPVSCTIFALSLLLSPATSTASPAALARPKLAPSAPAVPSMQEAVPLFDGESLTGWTGDAAHWSVQDGAITGTSTADNPLAANTFLIWEGEVADFELRLRFRIQGGNSGVQYRSKVLNADRHVVGGYQSDFCAIGPGQEWIPGICYEERGRGILARRGQEVHYDAAGKRSLKRQFATEAELLSVLRDGEWNEMRIRAVGPDLLQEINGQVVSMIHDHQEGRAAASGVLALQLHAGPPMRVQFKDLMLRRLGPDAGVEGPSVTATGAMVETPIIDLSGAAEGDALSEGPRPQWIWTGSEAGEKERVQMRTTFQGGAAKALLRATADNVLEVRLNGERVLSSRDWGSPVQADVSAKLRDGENVLEILAENEGGPGGAALKLALVAADGGARYVVSDGTWTGRAGDRPRDEFSAVHSLGEMGVGPWGDVFGGGGGGSATAETIKLRPGFQLELLYRVPKGLEGSWVTITNDLSDPGVVRFFVSDQYGGLFRVTPAGEGRATEVEVVTTEIGKAHGLLWAFDSLYLMGAGPQGTGMYRLFDRDGDGKFEETRFLAGFAVGSEHGAHAIHLGPSGQDLYVVAGNMTALPERVAEDSPRQAWANDFLNDTELPPSGHNAGGKPLGGYVLRTDPDGKQFTHVCGGYRNPYDMAFDEDGELYVYDSDMEYDGGAPWYRPTRLLHVLSGADFGWRRGAGKWPEYFADSYGSVIDIGQGSPTGVSFGHGAKFPERYQRALYLADWTYGRIRAVHLEPSGASATATAEDFVVGRPLPLTDLTIGVDGHMYFTVGGRRTQSNLFRLRYVGQEATDPAPPRVLDAATLRLRERRRALESMHRPIGSVAVDTAWASLGAPDRALRHAARVALEHQSLDLWAKRALAETSSRTAVHALIALARRGGPEHAEAVLDALSRLPLESLSSEQKLEALRAWSLAFIRLGEGRSDQRSRLRERLEAMFPGGERMVDRELARLLVHLGSTKWIEPALQLIESSPVQEEQMYYASLLRLQREGWTKERRARLLSWINKGRFRLVGSADFDAGGYFHYSGGRSFRPYVDVIRTRVLETMTEEEKAEPELAALIEAEAPPPLTEGEQILALQGQPVVWQVPDLVPLLGQVRSGRSFERGRAAFHAVRCAECHSFGRHIADTALGPDLTQAFGRFGPRDLLESIIEPSKEISDQYADHVVFTHSGMIHTGTVMADDAEAVVLRPDPKSDERIRIPRSDVEAMHLSRTSKMPGDLLNVLTDQQILDLIAYLLSGDDPTQEAFGDAAR